MTDDEKPAHQNVDKIRKENDRKFLYMAILTLILLGGGLIAFIWGPGALLTSFPFLLIGALLIALPYGVLLLLEKVVRRYDEY